MTEKNTSTQLITKAQLAKRWNVCTRHLDNMIASGELPIVRFGRRCVRIKTSVADSLVSRFEVAK